MTDREPIWNLEDVFVLEGQYHECCSCCAGYCPADETDALDRPYKGSGWYRIPGAYISDGFIAVREDMLRLPDGFKPVEVKKVPKEMFVPDAMPADESTHDLTAYLAGPLLDQGIEIHESGVMPQHLYYHGDHIGWVMAAYEGQKLGTIRKMRAAIRNRPLRELLDVIGGPHLAALAGLMRSPEGLHAAIAAYDQVIA